MRKSRKRNAVATAELPSAAPPQSRLLWCDDTTVLADVVTSNAPGLVLDGLMDVLTELHEPTLARPETLLVPVAAAFAPPVTGTEPYEADVLDLAGAAALQSPAITAVPGQRALDPPAGGGTALLTGGLASSASTRQLHSLARLLATQFAAIAPVDGVPFKRIVIAVAVPLEGVTRLTGSAPEIHFALDAPIAERPYQIGLALGAVLAREDHDGPLERVRVVMAERHTGGVPTTEAALLVAAMAAAAEQHGGARIDVTGAETDDDRGVFIPVVGDDPAMAERTAVLLEPYLTGVGRLTLGWEQKIG
jgi:hypothetical protein